MQFPGHTSHPFPRLASQKAARPRGGRLRSHPTALLSRTLRSASCVSHTLMCLRTPLSLAVPLSPSTLPAVARVPLSGSASHPLTSLCVACAPAAPAHGARALAVVTATFSPHLQASCRCTSAHTCAARHQCRGNHAGQKGQRSRMSCQRGSGCCSGDSARPPDSGAASLTAFNSLARR